MKSKIIAALLACIMKFSMCACGAAEQTAETAPSGGSLQTAAESLGDKEENYGNVFGQGEIIDVKVDLSAEDWQALQDNAQQELYYPANVTVNGTTVENVGFRAKGLSSLTSVASSDSSRYGFKIKTDEYDKGKTLNGLDMFVLNGSFADPSYMREYLTYLTTAYLDGVTPYLSYTNLYVNGELFGFYLMIEAYDDSFVERTTTAKDAVLYKADSETCTLLPEDDGTGFDVQYGTDDSYSNIKQLIEVLNSTTAENKDKLEEILDVDSALKAWAINTVMGNYDSYSGSKAHNYYLLYANGRFSYIGWDYNMSLGGFGEVNGGSVTADIASAVYNVESSKRPLIEKLLAVDEYKQRYLEYVNSLTDALGDFRQTITSLAEKIGSYVENDPSAFYTYEQFQSNIAESDTDLSQVKAGTSGGGKQRPDGAASAMPDGATPPDGAVPEMPDGTAPIMPDGTTQTNGTTPIMPDGATRPDGGQGQRPWGGGGMINSQAVSIVDYLIQRTENIKTQLETQAL